MDTFSELLTDWKIPSFILVVFLVTFLWKNKNKRPPQNETPTTIQSPQPKKQKKELKENPLRIFFGSQTGTAEDFSHKLALEGKQCGFDTEVIDLEDYDSEELNNESLVIFVVATYGEGEPTDNARTFYDWLTTQAEEESLSKVKYTVFGLGNKTYEHYNAMARIFDKRLEELGATRIFKRGEGDDDANLEDDFTAWKKELWPALCKEFGLEIKSQSLQSMRRWRIQYYDPDTPQAKQAFARVTPLSMKRGGSGQEISKNNPIMAKIVVNRELHGEGSDRSCRHLEIEISPKIKYETGDHVGIYPENDEKTVTEVAQRLGVKLDQVFTLYQDSKVIIGPCTVKKALTEWCDLLGIPRKSALEAFAHYATDEKEKKFLQELSGEDHQPYHRFIKEMQRSIVEILKEFSSVQIPFDHFLEVIPRLAPRMYSISSSPKKHPGHIHLTSVVVNFKTPTNREHDGVCSTWFKRIANREIIDVPIFIEKSHFRLPKDPKIPVIMVGPGTGIAPFRGFIQEREIDFASGKQSENILFFGCRNSKHDFIYKEELFKAKEEGILKELSIAFSREQNEKVYVQHKIHEHRELVWTMIHEKKGYFYICGDARNMAKDVRNCLHSIIKEFGQKTEEEAEQYIKEMQDSGRYLTDIWF